MKDYASCSVSPSADYAMCRAWQFLQARKLQVLCDGPVALGFDGIAALAN
jgi:hypothetical protein